MSQHPLLHQWCRAVEGGNLQEVLALYEGDALLKPTLSGEIRDGITAIGNYFEGTEDTPGFLGSGISEAAYQVEKELYLDHALIVMGNYQFTSEREVIKAHFTFVLKENAPGEFKILAQHSSLFV